MIALAPGHLRVPKWTRPVSYHRAIVTAWSNARRE